jgi:hypothetical protein
MKTEKFINFSKRHLEPITEANDCCICLTPSDRQTKKCSHPMCVECFYKLTDNDTEKIPCPICRKVLVKRRRTSIKESQDNGSFDFELYQLIQEEVERHPNLPRFLPASILLNTSLFRTLLNPHLGVNADTDIN